MIVIHSGNDFSVTNLFQFDYDFILINGGGSAKKTPIIRNIKKLFNFDCNDYVTLKKGDIVTVIMVNAGVQKAYECDVTNRSKVIVRKQLDININNTLKNLKNGRITR